MPPLTVVPVINVITNFIFEDTVPLLNPAFELLLASSASASVRRPSVSQPGKPTLVPFREPITIIE
jgi:hypothetical protein